MQSLLTGFLQRLLLRASLSPEDRHAILHMRGRVIDMQRGQELVVPDTLVEYATLVLDGIVGRYDQMADGRRQITAFHIPGDMCDLHSVPMPLPAWGIEALSPGRAMQVSHADLRRLVAERPAIAMAFWRDTVTDASILAKWAANIGRAHAAKRLAHLFCETGLRMEAAGLGERTRFALPVTQAHLADALGLTTVHVNRTIMALRPDCGLTMTGGEVRIADWDALARLAGFDDSYLLLRAMR